MRRHARKADLPATWANRIRALANVPPLRRMIWEISPLLALASVVQRGIAALIPVSQLWVGKLIMTKSSRLLSTTRPLVYGTQAGAFGL